MQTELWNQRCNKDEIIFYNNGKYFRTMEIVYSIRMNLFVEM